MVRRFKIVSPKRSLSTVLKGFVSQQLRIQDLLKEGFPLALIAQGSSPILAEGPVELKISQGVAFWAVGGLVLTKASNAQPLIGVSPSRLIFFTVKKSIAGLPGSNFIHSNSYLR